MTVWFQAKPELLAEVKRLVEAELPTFRLDLGAGGVFVRGSLVVNDATTRQELERYAIEIELANPYPERVPLVRETAGRLPKVLDRHFIPNTGNACLFLRDERWKHYPEGATIVDFVRGPVYQFFLWQAVVDNCDGEPLPARGHGVAGILEYYEEELGSDDPDLILRLLALLAADRITREHYCYCRSGKRLRRCHEAKVQDLRAKVPPERATMSYDALKVHIARMQVESSKSESMETKRTQSPQDQVPAGE